MFVPSQGSFLIWRHLFGEQIGRGGAAWTSAAAAACRRSSSRSTAPSTWTPSTSTAEAADATLLNAFRNGVVDRVSVAAVDLFPWTPEARYDVIVASLFQAPVDPLVAATRRVRSTTGAATRSTT